MRRKQYLIFKHMKRLVVHLYNEPEEMSYSSLETKSDVENRLARNVQRHAKSRKYNEIRAFECKKKEKKNYVLKRTVEID